MKLSGVLFAGIWLAVAHAQQGVLEPADHSRFAQQVTYILGPVGAVVASCPVSQQAIHDDCDVTKATDLTAARGSVQRRAAIKKCLEAHWIDLSAQSNNAMIMDYKTGNQYHVYTWGDAVKNDNILRLASEGKSPFQFQTGVQFGREARTCATAAKAEKAKVALARTKHAAAKDLTDLAAMEIAAAGADTIAYTMAACEEVYPGFLDACNSDFPTPTGTTDRDNGIKIGHRLSPGFDSTGGLGVYFATNPSQSVNHLRPGGYGLRCSMADTTHLLNILDPCIRRDLLAARILRPNPFDIEDQVPGIPPTLTETHTAIYALLKKNLMNDPLDFEHVMAQQGVAMAFATPTTANHRPYIVDKNAVDYTTCRKIKGEDLRCDDFKEVLSNDDALASILSSDDAFGKEILSKIKACTKIGPNPQRTFFKKTVWEGTLFQVGHNKPGAGAPLRPLYDAVFGSKAARKLFKADAAAMGCTAKFAMLGPKLKSVQCT